MRRRQVFRRKDQEFRRKDGTNTFVSRREEIKEHKIRKKGVKK